MIPGESRACHTERAARMELSEAQGRLAGEISTALGHEPTRLAPGSGIRGTLSTILDRLDSIERKLTGSTPPGHDGLSLPKKISMILILILLSINNVRWAYQQLKPGPANAQSTKQVGP
jgi:hypothetical protein